jgi:hypothetical protein
MRNLLFSTFIAVIFSAVQAFAITTNPTITSNGTKSFIIDKTIWKTNSVLVVIDDEEGNRIYNKLESLQKSKTFNLKKLETGNYTITVSNNLKSIKNNITITNEGLIIDINANTTFKPTFKIVDNSVDVNYLAAGVDTEISIVKGEETIHQSIIKDSLSINKRFDTSQLPAGTYSVVVSNKEGTFLHRFSK